MVVGNVLHEYRVRINLHDVLRWILDPVMALATGRHLKEYQEELSGCR